MNPAVELGLEIAAIALTAFFIVGAWPAHLCHHRDCPHKRNEGRKE